MDRLIRIGSSFCKSVLISALNVLDVIIIWYFGSPLLRPSSRQLFLHMLNRSPIFCKLQSSSKCKRCTCDDKSPERRFRHGEHYITLTRRNKS